jgi:hypothetical protein
VGLGVDAQEDLRDLAGGINQECVSRGELHDSEVGQRSVGTGDFVIGVREQLEIQTFLCTELLVTVDAVEANSQNNRVQFGVLGLVHLELVGFAGSTRGLILWIEIQHDPLATVIFEADGAILRLESEIWSHGSFSGFRRARQQAWNQQRCNNYDSNQ